MKGVVVLLLQQKKCRGRRQMRIMGQSTMTKYGREGSWMLRAAQQGWKVSLNAEVETGIEGKSSCSRKLKMCVLILQNSRIEIRVKRRGGM